MSLTPFDPTSPADTAGVSGGAAAIRNLTQLIVNFLTVSFDMTTGLLKPSAIPNGVVTPYGTAGQVYTSTGVSTPPAWVTPGTLITGMIIMWPGVAAPGGWLVCDGSTPLIATFPALASVLGTTYGGNGSTTFGLPDYRGRTPVGIGTGTATGATTWALGRLTGEETHVLLEAELAAHTHGMAVGGNRIQADGNAANPAGIISGVSATSTAPDGSNTPHNNLQPSIGMAFLVKT